MSNIVDLDALIPRDATVTFEGKEVTVKPPKVHTVLRIADYWQNIRLATVLDESELEKGVKNLQDEIIKCIPELEGHDLSYAQITTLVELLTKMTLPPETKEMKERGITVGETPDPKVP